MHAKVFQITKQRVDKENMLNENTLTQGDSSDYDYCSNISEEERKEKLSGWQKAVGRSFDWVD